MNKWVRIRIYGKVQGVYFRASAKEQAEFLALKGFVKNKPDGSVLIEAWGNESSIEQYLGWCKQGPRLARVDRTEVENVEGEPSFSEFSILK